MDTPLFTGNGLRLIINRPAEQIEHSAQCFLADGHLDARAGINCLRTANHAVGGAHGDTADNVVAQLLRDFAYQHAAVFFFDFNGIEQIRKLPVLETNVQNRSDDLHNMTDVFFLHTDFSFD